MWAGQFEQGHHSRIGSKLQPADVLVSKAGSFGESVLREAFPLPQPFKTAIHQIANVFREPMRAARYFFL